MNYATCLPGERVFLLLPGLSHTNLQWRGNGNALIKIGQITNDGKYINFAQKVATHIQFELESTETISIIAEERKA